MAKTISKISITCLIIVSLFNLFLPIAQADIFDEITFNLLIFETEDVYRSPGRERPFQTTVVRVVGIALSILGLLFLILIIYGGFVWLLAGGSEEEVKKATDIIKNGVIGLAIVLGAYAISWFVVRSLITSFG